MITWDMMKRLKSWATFNAQSARYFFLGGGFGRKGVERTWHTVWLHVLQLRRLLINDGLKVNRRAVTELTDWSSPLAPPDWPSGSGEGSAGASLAWEWGQSEDEFCCGAGVDAAWRGRKRRCSVFCLSNDLLTPDVDLYYMSPALDSRHPASCNDVDTVNPWTFWRSLRARPTSLMFQPVFSALPVQLPSGSRLIRMPAEGRSFYYLPTSV